MLHGEGGGDSYVPWEMISSPVITAFRKVQKYESLFLKSNDSVFVKMPYLSVKSAVLLFRLQPLWRPNQKIYLLSAKTEDTRLKLFNGNDLVLSKSLRPKDQN